MLHHEPGRPSVTATPEPRKLRASSRLAVALLADDRADLLV
jgi:hypothetical protein